MVVVDSNEVDVEKCVPPCESDFLSDAIAFVDAVCVALPCAGDGGCDGLCSVGNTCTICLGVV